MKKLVVSTAIALALLTGSAFAKSEVQTTRTIWEMSDFPGLAEKAKAVCESKTVQISARLRKACDTGQFPRVTKAGMFYNTGYGAELNSIIRQGSTAEAK
jgi:hypothetical protein